MHSPVATQLTYWITALVYRCTDVPNKVASTSVCSDTVGHLSDGDYFMFPKYKMPYSTAAAEKGFKYLVMESVRLKQISYENPTQSSVVYKV